jgi:hypothetical protein
MFTYTPETVGVPKELLFEDFKQQCTNLQGQYTRMHNRMQLMIGLNTALLPTLGAVFLASSKGDVGRPWLILFPVTGLLLSTIGFLTGATDRRLVTIYRGQLSWTANCVLSAYVAGPCEYQGWLHIGLDPTGVSDKLDKWNPSPRIEGEPFRWRQMTKRTWWSAHMALPCLLRDLANSPNIRDPEHFPIARDWMTGAPQEPRRRSPMPSWLARPPCTELVNMSDESHSQAVIKARK